MDLEETKKIIQSKIEAEAATKNVRSKIKSYIHEKQNLRKGFKETFKPLIKSQDKVKESIDNQQNAMIKQLQENQLALTEGLDKNRLAITQGFDKMDEVKKWDLQQLPGYEAIEEPEEVPEDETKYRISFKDLNKIFGHDKYPNDDKIVNINKKSLDAIIKTYDFYNQNKYEIKIVDPNTRLLKVMNKQPILTYDKNERDKNLMNKETTDLLYFYSLELPSEYKDKSLKELQEALKKSQNISSKYKVIIKNVAKYDYFEGKSIAYPKSKNPSAKT